MENSYSFCNNTYLFYQYILHITNIYINNYYVKVCLCDGRMVGRENERESFIQKFPHQMTMMFKTETDRSQESGTPLTSCILVPGPQMPELSFATSQDT